LAYTIFVSDSITAKKEAKRLEKEAKLAAKAVKNAASAAVGVVAGEKKAKAEKKKEEEETPFVNATPKGEKKGAHKYEDSRIHYHSSLYS
jgi:uncharacterized membrane protein YebE (DUF533 family)